MAWPSRPITVHDPGLIVLDTSANPYGGDEIMRAQVRGFIGMLRALAAPPSFCSRTPRSQACGQEAATAWTNSVRSRLYLTQPTGESADPERRILTAKKANYGKSCDGITMRWEDGAFTALPASELAFVMKRHDSVF